MFLVIKMRIYPDMKRTLISFSIVSLLILVLFYFTFDGSFTWPLPIKDYIAFAGWLIITAVYFFITLRLGYYTVEKNALYQRRLTKVFCYQYKDVIYIDVDWSKKNKILFFVTNRGDTIYLMMDKKQLLLEKMLEKCHNLVEKDDIKRRFPNIKI